MTIGERIYYCRIENKMTQNQLAEKAGMADSAIRKYESGRVTPKFDTLNRIAAALDVPWTTLYPDGETLPGTEKPTPEPDIQRADAARPCRAERKGAGGSGKAGA